MFPKRKGKDWRKITRVNRRAKARLTLLPSCTWNYGRNALELRTSNKGTRRPAAPICLKGPRQSDLSPRGPFDPSFPVPVDRPIWSQSPHWPCDPENGPSPWTVQFLRPEVLRVKISKKCGNDSRMKIVSQSPIGLSSDVVDGAHADCASLLWQNPNGIKDSGL